MWMGVLSLWIITGCGPQAPDYSGRDFVAEPIVEVTADLGESWMSLNSTNDRMIFGTHDENWSGHTLYESKKQNGSWLTPNVLPFSGTYNDRGARFYPALDAVLFSSDRPLEGESEAGDFNLWIAVHDGEAWMEPEAMFATNSEAEDFHGSVSGNGSIYFASNRDGGEGRSDLYKAVLHSNGYEIEALGAPVNTSMSESDVFVSENEDYIIFARTDDPNGLGGDDLFISFAQGDGWSEPQNLGPEANGADYEYGAEVSRDGRLLTYTSHSLGKADIVSIPLSALRIEWPE